MDDVLVLQVREALRLALEPRDDVLLSSCAGFQRLDRDRAAERVLHGAVNDRHAAGGDLFHDAAVADAFEHGSAKTERIRRLRRSGTNPWSGIRRI